MIKKFWILQTTWLNGSSSLKTVRLRQIQRGLPLPPPKEERSS